MVQETIFQHWIFTQFAFPFLLIWTLVFALLGKTKLLGDNKQIDSIVAFVIAFVFIGAAYPKDIVHNLVLFLTVAIVIVFVGLLLWGFASGSDLSKDFLTNTGVKWVTGFGIFIAVTIAVFWATGTWDNVVLLLFKQSWSNTLWTNVTFVVVIAVALAVMMKAKK